MKQHKNDDMSTRKIGVKKKVINVNKSQFRDTWWLIIRLVRPDFLAKKRGIQGETSFDSHDLTTGGMGFKVIARDLRGWADGKPRDLKHERWDPPNGGLIREFPLFQGNLAWWNIIVWPEFCVWEFYAIYL